jgi:hypothetical protein
MKVGFLGMLLVASCGGVGVNLGDGGATDGSADSSADALADANPNDSSTNDAGMVSIQIGNCQQFTPCGGAVVGTWAFGGGCIADPLAESKSLCPALQVVSQTASASGTVSFTPSFITRSYTTSYAMDVIVPTACLANESCAQIQSALAVYIPNAMCSAVSSGCSCTGSVDSAATQAAAYTLMNDEVVAGADHYAYCVSGTAMQYTHVSGPSPEVGTYDLNKP